MLKKHNQFFESILMASDIAIVSASWLFAYAMRFAFGPIPAWKGVPEISQYTLLLTVIVPLYVYFFIAYGLYRSMRITSFFDESFKVIKASVMSLVLLIALSFLVRQYEYSRGVFLYFFVLQLVLVIGARALFRFGLRSVRRRGYNLRYILVVGAGRVGQEIVSKVHKRGEFGLRVVGFLTRKKEKLGRTIKGVKVVGTYDDLPHVIKQMRVDQVIIALPYDAHENLEKVLKCLEDEIVDVRVVPDVYQFITLRGGIEDFDGIPFVNLQDSPFYGWNIVLKRLLDIILASIILILISPLFLAIALAVRLTSPGPVLYRQERTGLDGKSFVMFKFRTMRDNAESATGPVWATDSDARKTPVGAFLRRTSLDEIPQFLNVLAGDMSIVGPRPEREHFVKKFRAKIPRYMLRHKVKAGITGWAQVNGWRGNTSMERRIEHDLYYIENWSLGFDFKIMALTVVKGFINKHAY